MTFERGEYKGNPMLIIKRDEKDRFPFSLGLRKAEMLLQTEVQNQLEKFVLENKPDDGLADNDGEHA
jgi:hypothetical protein